ncbi:MAG: hypothetical protein ACRDGN_03595, partial [bacterium]
LRRVRAGSGPSASAKIAPASGKPARAAATVTLVGVTPQRYDSFQERTDDLRFHIGMPVVHGAVLRQLGTPPSWSLRASPVELLSPAVADTAALARELALGSPLPAQASPITAPRVAGSRRARRAGTARRGPEAL